MYHQWRGGDDGMTLRKWFPTRWDHPTVEREIRKHDEAVARGMRVDRGDEDTAALALVKAILAEGGVFEGTGQLVKHAASPAMPHGAIREARARARDLAVRKEAGVLVNDAHRQEAERLAEALEMLPTAPRPVSDYSGAPPVGGPVRQHTTPLEEPQTPVPAPWSPHAGDVAAREGAAALAGNPRRNRRCHSR